MMHDDLQDTHRHHLLSILFGSHVPHGLEGQLLRTSDVATLFQVSERTVSEWAKRGQIPSVRTPGGHRRYPADGILALVGRDSGDRTHLASREPAPTR
jgi:excisionase family DNA binding protein